MGIKFCNIGKENRVGGGTEEQDCEIAEYVVSVFEQETK